MRRLKIPDYFISLTIFLASAIGATLTYASIRQSKQRLTVIVPSIPLGRQDYYLNSGGSCAGTVATTLLAVNNGFDFRTQASVRVKARGEVSDVKFVLDAQFNTIGQLGASVVKVTGPAGNFSFGTTEINPIHFKIRINTDGFQKEHSFDIPGPIELKRARKDYFNIEYERVDELLRGTRRFVAHLPHGSLDVALLPAPENATCARGSAGFFDLDPSIDGVRSILGNFQNLVPGFLSEN